MTIDWVVWGPPAAGLCAGLAVAILPVVRLRTEANRNPDEVVAHPLRGQGAKFSREEQFVWRFWSGAFAHPRAYKVLRWAATRRPVRAAMCAPSSAKSRT